MTPERRKQIVAMALLAVLAVALGVRLWPLVSGGSGGGRSLWGGSDRRPAARAANGDVLELADLAPEVSGQRQPRDLFRFGEVERPAPPPMKPPPPRPTPVRTPPPELPPAGPQPPALELTYLGWFGPKTRPIAAFTDGENLFVARRGEVLADHFRVLDIGLESVDVGFVDFPDVPARRLVVGS